MNQIIPVYAHNEIHAYKRTASTDSQRYDVDGLNSRNFLHLKRNAR
jgi:hypothetical protein